MKTSSDQATAGIHKTLGIYAAGLRDGSVAQLKRAFRPQALVSGYIGEEKFVKPVAFLYAFVRKNKAAVKKSPPPAPEVRAITISGNTAVVTLLEKAYLGDDYTTFLQLMQMGSRWWIVSKLFNGTPAKP